MAQKKYTRLELILKVHYTGIYPSYFPENFKRLVLPILEIYVETCSENGLFLALCSLT